MYLLIRLALLICIAFALFMHIQCYILHSKTKFPISNLKTKLQTPTQSTIPLQFAIQPSSSLYKPLYSSVGLHSYASSSLDLYQERQINWKEIRQKSLVFLKKSLIIIIPIIMVAILCHISPVFAKEMNNKATKVKGKVSKIVGKVQKKTTISFWKKILDGANTKGKLKNWKVGDTRAEFAALLNAASGIFVLGGLSFFAFLLHKSREMKQNRAYDREVIKAKQYKENMYFEAVEEILTKLNDPKLKNGQKMNLQRDLKELDPEGKIIKYIRDGKTGEKPNIENYMNTPSNAKKGLKKKNEKKVNPIKEVVSKTNSFDGNEEDSSLSEEELHLEVLADLYDNLKGVISDSIRKQLVEFLKNRIESISDNTKRKGAINKIAEKINDLEYWKEYSQRFT